MSRFDDDTIHKHAATMATGTEKNAVLALSETAHDGYLADNFNVADGEW